MYGRILKTPLYRNSHQSCSIMKGAPRNFANFTGNHLCQSLFLNKVAVQRSTTLLKKRLWHRCFPLNFAKFLRTPFYRAPLGDFFCTDELDDHCIFMTSRQQPVTAPLSSFSKPDPCNTIIFV